MKKQILSFVMMLALVIVAGTAMAQTAITPYAGSTYTYTLDGVKLNSAGTADVSLIGGTSWSLVSASDQSGALTVAGTNVTIPTSSTSLIFVIKYNDDETAGAKTLKVLLTDGSSLCTNYINLAVTVVAKPTLSLAVTSVADFCQTTDNITNNTAGSVGASNTFTFTITPTFSAGALAAGATYAYEFDLNDYLIGATDISIQRTGGAGTDDDGGAGVGTTITVTGATDVQTITVTFATTTGLAPETITGTVSTGVLTAGGSGSGTYDASYSPASEDVVVKSTPSIGTFTY